MVCLRELGLGGTLANKKLETETVSESGTGTVIYLTKGLKVNYRAY